MGERVIPYVLGVVLKRDIYSVFGVGAPGELWYNSKTWSSYLSSELYFGQLSLSALVSSMRRRK